MTENVGSIDKGLRIIVGVLLLAGGYYYKLWFGLIGLIPIVTAFIGWCPVYVPFGISTCKKNKDTENN